MSSCTKCSRLFKSPQGLACHLRGKSCGLSLECEKCGKKFISNFSFERHKKRKTSCNVEKKLSTSCERITNTTNTINTTNYFQQNCGNNVNIYLNTDLSTLYGKRLIEALNRFHSTQHARVWTNPNTDGMKLEQNLEDTFRTLFSRDENMSLLCVDRWGKEIIGIEDHKAGKIWVKLPDVIINKYIKNTLRGLTEDFSDHCDINSLPEKKIKQVLTSELENVKYRISQKENCNLHELTLYNPRWTSNLRLEDDSSPITAFSQLLNIVIVQFCNCDVEKMCIFSHDKQIYAHMGNMEWKRNYDFILNLFGKSQHESHLSEEYEEKIHLLLELNYDKLMNNGLIKTMIFQ